MQSSSYHELIEEKIVEWQSKLTNLEENIRRSGQKNYQEKIKMLETLNSAVNSAALQLRALDVQEDADSTMEIKDKILAVFDAVDRNLVEYEETTPFML